MIPCIRVIDLWKLYYEGNGQGFAALRGTTMEVKAGEQVALYGASGSGKTTLLNLLAGLDQPTSGSIEIDGQRIDALGEKGRTQLRRQRLGFVFQFFNLLPTLTIQENIFLALELAGKPDDKAVPEILKEVGLTGKEGRYPHQLSGGEQQRVAIARALVKEPTLILADEPTGNLDSATGLQILDLLRFRCAERATTLLMATHSPLACNFVNRVLRIEDGVIREEISASRDERT